MPQNSELIRAEAINYAVSGREGPQEVLRKVTCSVKERSFNVVLGANGAGKTTFMRILTGLLRPSSGTVTFRNQTIADHHRRNIGYMSENEKLPAVLTPKELLRHRARIFTLENPEKKVTDALDQFGISVFSGRKISRLSQGQKRRVSFAAACLHTPDLLVLDEPFSGLDPPGRLELARCLWNFHEAGCSVVFCTHDLHLIPAGYHQMLIFSRGMLSYCGLSEEKKLSQEEILSYYQ